MSSLKQEMKHVEARSVGGYTNCKIIPKNGQPEVNW